MNGVMLDVQKKMCPDGKLDHQKIYQVYMRFSALFCEDDEFMRRLISQPLEYSLNKTYSMFLTPDKAAEPAPAPEPSAAAATVADEVAAATEIATSDTAVQAEVDAAAVGAVTGAPNGSGEVAAVVTERFRSL